MSAASFVQAAFRRYYENSQMTSVVPALEKREFGFASFDGRMIRHRGFGNMEELASFLMDCVPQNAYVSCGYYADPTAEMEKKDWLGADLVFDIDADHIPTPCDKVHDDWACVNCRFVGKGIVPEKCPVCGCEKFDGRTWPCEVCLDSAKAETLKLLDILEADFGLSENEIRVFFSGHRGYHVHVESESTETLDAVARKEIVDYVTGLGLELPFVSPREQGRKTKQAHGVLPALGFGWPNRLVARLKEFVLNANEQDLTNVGLRKKEARTLLSKKDSILRTWRDTGVLKAARGIGLESLRKIAEHSVKTGSAKIDTVVTTDIHRLIRLPDTLHGKTGWKKAEFPVSNIDGFDPFKNAIAFKEGTATVFVSQAPEFRLGDETFGPYKNQKAELPTAAAVLLVCRGRAEVVKQDV